MGAPAPWSLGPAATRMLPAEPDATNGAGKAHFEAQKQRARDEEKRKRRVTELESSIAVAETELGLLREKLKADHGGDWTRLAELAERERELSRKVETMMSEWEKLSS